MSQLKQLEGNGQILPLMFCFIQPHNGLVDTYPQCRGHAAFPSPLIEILISSRNTFTDVPRNDV